MIDWQDLYVFSVLARRHSLSAAARELQIEHATVGRRIDALEKTLGLKLVDRLPRSRPLTADGVALSRILQTMPDIAAQVQQLARRAAIDVAGTVRVSAPPSLAMHTLAPRMGELRRQHPGLQVVLLPALSLMALDKGEADIALRTVRPEQAGVSRRRVGIVRFALYGSAEFAGRPPAQWTFIAYDDSLDLLPQQRWLHEVRQGRPVVFSASELVSQQMAARQGLGAVVLPTALGDSDAALQRLPVEVAPVQRELWLTVYPDMRRSPAVKAVMDFLIACIESEPQLRVAPAGR